VVFAGFLLFGEQIMSLFGGDARTGALLLVILSVGLLVDAATGPSRIVMMMTGHEHAYVRIFGVVILAGMVVQIPVILEFGVIGAAIVNTLARIAAQLAIAWYSHRRIGLDTTLLGAFLLNRLRDRGAA
jgi:O-antigen/teichoic acid export membrane protein